MPDTNKRNVEEMDKEITQGLTITYVSRMEQVLERAFYEQEDGHDN